MKQLIVGNGKDGSEIGIFYSRERIHDEIAVWPLGKKVTARVTRKESISNMDDTRRGFKIELLIMGEKYELINFRTCKNMLVDHTYDLTIKVVYVKSLDRDVPYIKCSRPYEEPSKMMDPLRLTMEYLQL